ncbi:MAG: polynucleotide adenylyltransferase [Robiginitomaculum sp.]|nr:MAG: polynucleotide adenylyltransferase [Robiginitomaculum sp.]
MKLNVDKHAWLTAKPTQRLFAALPKGTARFVGGCVRNALLGEPVADYDVATTVEPHAVAKHLKAANIGVHETGIAHGTLTAVVDGTVFEVTTLRRDVSTDGRRATVEFTTDWAADAHRRDFTINALYTDLSGEIYDPTKQGLADIKTRKIRFVGNAETRIEEDYLRILRFFRFNAWYAEDRALDAVGLTACRELKVGLKTLSSERVWSELKKLLSAPTPFRTVNVMSVNGILETLLPEASNSEGLQLVCELEKNKSLSPDPYLRLMAMSARDELAMARLCKRLKMSNKEKARLKHWAGDQTNLQPGLPDKETKILIYTAGQQVAMDRAILRSAGASDPIEAAAWWTLHNTAQNWQWPEFPVTGKDLIAVGIPHGEKLGKALTALKALWIRSGFKVEKPQLIVAAKMLFKQ